MKKLAQIQKELKAPKSQRNSFGNYNYRNCEDILEALKPLLDEDDKFFISDEIWMVGDRYYVKATATFNDVTVTAYAREAEEKKGMDASQITGATSSYARKYALNALFAIDDTKDADSEEPVKKSYPTTQVRSPMFEARAWIKTLDTPEKKEEARQRITTSTKFNKTQKDELLQELN